MKEAFVNEIATKTTSYGDYHDIILSNGDRVGVGKFPPKGISAGDFVEYDVIMKGKYMNLKPGSLSKKDAPAGITAPAKQPGFVPSSDKRQEVISKQAALNSALQFVNILVAADALPMPKATKVGEKADLLHQVVDRYTGLFYKQATGLDMEFTDREPSAGGNDLSAKEDGDNWQE